MIALVVFVLLGGQLSKFLLDIFRVERTLGLGEFPFLGVYAS
jgi:hypothetical protein